MNIKERILYELNCLKPFDSVFYDMVKSLSDNKSLFNKELKLIELVKNIKDIGFYGLRDSKIFFDILIHVEIFKLVSNVHPKTYILDDVIILKDINVKWIEKSIKEERPYKDFTRIEKIKSFLED